jgi:soluble lytic murein transglycosylase-like protein
VAATAAAATTPAATTASAETAQPPATQPLTTVGGEPTAYDPEIEAAGARYGVDPNLVKAVIEQESGFDPTATSGVGAQGLMQLMPETARGLGISDAYDPAQAIDAGTRYLKEQLDRFGGDESLALAAYNAGPAAVARFGGVPPYGETQNYVQSVLANLTSFKNTDQ